MTPGGNAPLTATRVTVEVTALKPLNVSGLLLTEAGKARSDADLVFRDAPKGPGVAHRPAARNAPAAITVDTAALPREIGKVVVTANLDHASDTLAGTEPTATVRDSITGAVLVTFTPRRLSRETALVVVELYRRGDAWKVRAVGQGYANGMAGIAGDFGVSVPSRASAAPPKPVGPPAASPPLAKVTLDKGKVSLVKGGSVSLEKNGKPLLSSVRMALGWEPARQGRNIDLDASCIAYDAQRERIETAWFMKLNVFDGAIAHSGDSLTGEGSGDDESVTVHLDGLPSEVCGLVFVVNSFSGQKFTEIRNAYCRLLDAGSGQELVRFDLTHSEPMTGVVMCKLVRQYSGEWVMTALGEYVDAKTARGMVKPAAAML
ncbi:TerD family protein [Kitasatospora sp. HPMI-4]|uniref:TerD family protein n=1 Tax=Kitasatospora sp. HPMI-4 TaxID=3448443 RepID=UPI003F19CCD7